ncbi:MAG: LarC family nickel insertion protein, partial [Chloroflexi bacterium]|nr:LarC family nickel insertion protein [Chloroflexota bacterium]
MRIAYFDCVAGASGDMLLGALIDAGASLAVLRENIATLQLSGCDLHVEQVMRGALAARRVTVVTPQPETERHVKDLVAVIDQAGLPEVVKERSRATLLRIAQAEAHIHQHPVEEIHLHELGGDDTLIDIVGVVSALESLEITKVFVSPLPLSLGFVHCMHGLIPLPAPATLALLEG